MGDSGGDVPTAGANPRGTGGVDGTMPGSAGASLMASATPEECCETNRESDPYEKRPHKKNINKFQRSCWLIPGDRYDIASQTRVGNQMKHAMEKKTEIQTMASKVNQ